MAKFGYPLIFDSLMLTMKNSCLVYAFIILFFSLSATAQQKVTVSGKIVDSETKEPLPFASIAIKGRAVSTVSNLQGEFDFHFSRNYIDENLIIRMLGYVDIEVPVRNVLSQDSLIFPMVKAVQMLQEVVVSDTLSGEEIIKIAINRIEQNHPEQPYLLKGFYRDLKKLGGVYFSILEAAVKIYDENYEEPKNKWRLRERVSLTEVRKSIGYDNKFTSYFDQVNLLEDLLLHNPVKYRLFPEDPAFYDNMKRLKNSYYNGRQVYVLQFNVDQRLTFYIDNETYAFLRIENEISHDDVILKSKKDLYSKFEYKKLILDFIPYKQKMYPHYMKVISQINWYDKNTDELSFETELHQELLINEVFPNTDTKIKGFEKMRKYGLQYQDLPYNKDFWDNYNVIKQTPLDKEIVEDLERQGALPEGMDVEESKND